MLGSYSPEIYTVMIAFARPIRSRDDNDFHLISFLDGVATCFSRVTSPPRCWIKVSHIYITESFISLDYRPEENTSATRSLFPVPARIPPRLASLCPIPFSPTPAAVNISLSLS